MRISDGSSDVCSSDLRERKKKATVSGGLVTHATLHDCDARKIDACKSSSRNVVRLLRRRFGALSLAGVHSLAVAPGCADFAHVRELEIGRSSCRERVCQ